MRASREIVADVRRTPAKVFTEMVLALTDEAAIANSNGLRITLKALHGFTPVRSTPSLFATRVP